jgi:hypothetical protein
MSEQSVLELMKNWGYYQLAKPHPDSPGYSGLLVAIRKGNRSVGVGLDSVKYHTS